MAGCVWRKDAQTIRLDLKVMTVETKAHVPVLLAGFLAVARPEAGQRWVDGTFGRGGYSEALLQAGADVLAMDCDVMAAERAGELAARYGDRFVWRHGNFTEMSESCAERGWQGVSGVVLDLGVSSPQLDTAERGFSFRLGGPLDMRMDQRQTLTAAQLVNEESMEELERIFRIYGDERDARRIARALVGRREDRPFADTLDLAEVVARCLPRRAAQRVHPATKVFQALRIAVNREVDALAAVLPQAMALLQPEAILAVISFHSGEDRVVKHFIRSHQQEFLDRPESPVPVPNPEYWLDRSQRVLPSEKDIALNPRCRSARLRLAWRNGRVL